LSESLSPTEALVRQLYSISADYGAGFENQLDRLLAAGRERLELDIGIVARVEGDLYTVLRAVTPDDSIPAGAEFPLANTYCEATVRADGPIGFEHAGESEWHSHPCYAAFRLEAYLGAPVRVGDAVWGTLNFSSPTPRQRAWDKRDLDSIRLMTAWIGGELLRRRIEDQLREALAQVKTLEGLLPICATCKKIRESDDAGQERWTPIEGYVMKRTQAEFSHGMCPACAERWFNDPKNSA
jgi:GAF domain-containing protein